MTREYPSADTPDYPDNTESLDTTAPAQPTSEFDADYPAPASVPAVQEAPVEHDEPSKREQKKAAKEAAKVKSSFAGGTWAALIIGAILLIVLIVFILQNPDNVEVNLFAWTWEFPAGIAYLLSAIIGALIMALVGGWRMFELRRQVKKAAKFASH
ncbi:DUF1049 domain-containing protein [Corynebacterium breve]|uniref:DUF1049 domain-containing protein n=1 Tax=Corynebacterium breve TaxID=3049799 RepID=A0ABY8VF35_9CORY|nr:lipopolysaccharide assembly LapA domain-containing protein [Corynebacterium breve]WIM66873.1 DUF1049 domain-containing protein [Corynebacterium breve]